MIEIEIAGFMREEIDTIQQEAISYDEGRCKAEIRKQSRREMFKSRLQKDEEETRALREAMSVQPDDGKVTWEEAFADSPALRSLKNDSESAIASTTEEAENSREQTDTNASPKSEADGNDRLAAMKLPESVAAKPETAAQKPESDVKRPAATTQSSENDSWQPDDIIQSIENYERRIEELLRSAGTTQWNFDKVEEEQESDSGDDAASSHTDAEPFALAPLTDINEIQTMRASMQPRIAPSPEAIEDEIHRTLRKRCFHQIEFVVISFIILIGIIVYLLLHL